MTELVGMVGGALEMAAGMVWQTAWTLVLGFTLSALLQAVVPAEAMRRALGRAGPKEIALATLAGAASSSCSYASAAIMRTMFKKGAALVPALAFMIASTNLVLEFGIILVVLMGWPFMAGEWIGGVVLVAIMSVLIRLTLPPSLAEEARRHDEQGGGHEHMSMVVQGTTWWDRLRNPETRIRIAQNFCMEWSMLWKDLAVGFLVGGFVAAFVPHEAWKALFLSGSSPWLAAPLNAIVGPIVAMLTFVCSIGNVPLAAVLWAGGASFGGVLAFLYADLIVLPLLDAYRRYFGWRMAAYIGGVFFVTMAASAMLVDLTFTALGWVPAAPVDTSVAMAHISLNYTFGLNLVFGALAAYWMWVSRRHPMDHSHHGHGHGHPMPGEPAPAGHQQHHHH